MKHYAHVIFKGATNTTPARMSVRLHGEKNTTVHYCAALGPDTETKDWAVYAVTAALEIRKVNAVVIPDGYGALPDGDRVVEIEYQG